MSACSDQQASIYDGLEEQDGVMVVDVEEDNPEFPPVEDENPVILGELSKAEKDIIEDYYKNLRSQVSFIVVDAEQNTVVRAHQAQEPRRLASVSKVFTGLAALDEVNNVSVSKVSSMLRSSNNGEASRYVRLAGKAIDDHTTTGSTYTQGASCPSAFRNDFEAAQIVLDWWQSRIPEIDWSQADLQDGAGCDYDNQMTALQIAYSLRYASERGEAYGGMSFEELLSISGQTGTWRNFNTDASGQIFAKTGTLTPNSNLAGYFYTRRGGEQKKYYFTVFIEKRANLDSSAQARKLIEALLRHWIRHFGQEAGTSLASL